MTTSCENKQTLCGINTFMVVCTFEPPDGECFYPSGPCRVGKERRKAGEACEGTPYGEHLHRR